MLWTIIDFEISTIKPRDEKLSLNCIYSSEAKIVTLQELILENGCFPVRDLVNYLRRLTWLRHFVPKERFLYIFMRVTMKSGSTEEHFYTARINTFYPNHPC